MRRIALLLILPLLFGGCAKRPESAYRVVTEVQVEYKNGADTILRSYTKPKSIQSILTYLRILRPYGPTVPKEAAESTCQFTLRYSHGPSSVYLQQGNAYLQRDNGPWSYIDRSHATLLYPLLLLLPSDQ